MFDHRYQWSVGYTSGDSPEGVFDASTELVWHDAASITQMTYTTKKGLLANLYNGLSFMLLLSIYKECLIFKVPPF